MASIIYAAFEKKMNKPETPKIVIVTIPLRGHPSGFPPIGSLSVITSLKRAGFTNTFFYNIDYLRPTFEEIIDRLKKGATRYSWGQRRCFYLLRFHQKAFPRDETGPASNNHFFGR